MTSTTDASRERERERERYGVKPIPDPTVLTMDAVRDAVGHLRELLEGRLNERDRAFDVLTGHIEEVSKSIGFAVASLEKLHDERFKSIDRQFHDRDRLSEQISKDANIAIAAALQAAKELVGEQNRSNVTAIEKSDKAFTKQIEQLAELLKEMQNGTNGKIDDLKTALATYETRLTAHESRSTGRSDGWGYVVGIGGFVFGLIGAIGIIVAMVIHKG